MTDREIMLSAEQRIDELMNKMLGSDPVSKKQVLQELKAVKESVHQVTTSTIDYHIVVDNLDDNILIADASETILYVNKAYQKSSGIPKENLIGREGMGYKIAMGALAGGRIGIGAQSVGIAQGALNEAIKYVKERKQFGKPIAKFQNTQFLIAALQTKIDAARLMVWRAAKAKDDHENFAPLAAQCKLFASDVAVEVTRGAVQMLGGYGYSREYPVERMYRDAKITEIYEGTSEVMKMVISGSLLR